MPGTRNAGVYYNLMESPYVTYHSGMYFYFSSEFNKARFNASILNEINRVNFSLSKRFKLEVNADAVAALCLYRKIEKRGYRVEGQKAVESVVILHEAISQANVPSENGD